MLGAHPSLLRELVERCERRGSGGARRARGCVETARLFEDATYSMCVLTGIRQLDQALSVAHSMSWGRCRAVMVSSRSGWRSRAAASVSHRPGRSAAAGRRRGGARLRGLETGAGGPTWNGTTTQQRARTERRLTAGHCTSPRLLQPPSETQGRAT
ncbi:DUF5133 domain-containing protein [Streptomyces sp. NPDC048254]|uniref:DUF5133 domain-containing protein n=1 Tax=Streptomyces sp. NPDC048254 TaxID=3365525 RepID=UPI00371068F9